MATNYRQRTKPWYGTTRWKKRRAQQLASDPICWMCLETGKVTEASIADHDPPHKGDEVAFFTGPLRSLCKPCHDRHKQRQERGGTSPAYGADGWPLT